MKRRGFLSLLGFGSAGLALKIKPKEEELFEWKELSKKVVLKNPLSSIPLYPCGAIRYQANGDKMEYRSEDDLLYGWYYMKGTTTWPK